MSAEQIIADALADLWLDELPRDVSWAGRIAAALRSAGLLAESQRENDGKVLVDREALQHVWLCAGGPGYCALCDRIRAALDTA